MDAAQVTKAVLTSVAQKSLLVMVCGHKKPLTSPFRVLSIVVLCFPHGVLKRIVPLFGVDDVR